MVRGTCRAKQGIESETSELDPGKQEEASTPGSQRLGMEGPVTWATHLQPSYCVSRAEALQH